LASSHAINSPLRQIFSVAFEFLAGVFGFGLDIVRDHFGVVPSLLGGLAGLFAGMLILRRRAGPKGNGKGNNSG
jgi:F0F1-type ATP synthase assembly protein I